jgi:hypothetical protein
MKLSVIIFMGVVLWLGSGQGEILPVLNIFCLPSIRPQGHQCPNMSQDRKQPRGRYR